MSSGSKLGAFAESRIQVEPLLSCIARAQTEDQLFAELAHVVCDAAGADHCVVLLRDDKNGLVLHASTGLEPFSGRIRLGPGIGLCGQALLQNDIVIVGENAIEDPRYVSLPGVDDSQYQACAAIPLEGQGGVYGVLTLETHVPLNVTKPMRLMLRRLGRLAALTIEAFRNAHNSGSGQSPLGALSEVTKTLSSSPYLEEILQLLVNLTAQQFKYKVCTVRLLDAERGELVLRATQATVKAYQRKRAIKLGESIAGKAIAEGKPVIVQDVLIEQDYVGHDLAVEMGLRSMICVPLRILDRTVGVMSCYTDSVHEFTDDEIKALETLAQQAAISIEHAKMQVRNTLMQEMHHRVKNNLQQVASLLRLQLGQSHIKSLEEAINDVLARILAIASVHDLLSREDLDHVGMLSIAETLIHYHQSSLINPEKSIHFEVRGVDVRLNMNQATQVALVLNELVSNAVEHGFETKDSGEIHVTIEEGEDEVSLWVSNNGDSLPEGFNPETMSHLGLQICESLTRALGGRFKISDIFGWTVAEVKFTRSGGE